MGVRISMEQAKSLGIDVDAGQKARLPRPEMNKTEMAYKEYLEMMKLNGLVSGYRFGAIKLRLAKKTWYTPDFLVRLNDGSFEIHEVKGFMRDDAAVKIKVAAEMYPWFRFVVVRKEGAGWGLETIHPGQMAV